MTRSLSAYTGVALSLGAALLLVFACMKEPVPDTEEAVVAAVRPKGWEDVESFGFSLSPMPGYRVRVVPELKGGAGVPWVLSLSVDGRRQGMTLRGLSTTDVNRLSLVAELPGEGGHEVALVLQAEPQAQPLPEEFVSVAARDSVTVRPWVSPKGLSFPFDTLRLTEGDSLAFRVSVEPGDASVFEWTWGCSPGLDLTAVRDSATVVAVFASEGTLSASTDSLTAKLPFVVTAKPRPVPEPEAQPEDTSNSAGSDGENPAGSGDDAEGGNPGGDSSSGEGENPGGDVEGNKGGSGTGSAQEPASGGEDSGGNNEVSPEEGSGSGQGDGGGDAGDAGSGSGSEGGEAPSGGGGSSDAGGSGDEGGSAGSSGESGSGSEGSGDSGTGAGEGGGTPPSEGSSSSDSGGEQPSGGEGGNGQGQQPAPQPAVKVSLPAVTLSSSPVYEGDAVGVSVSLSSALPEGVAVSGQAVVDGQSWGTAATVTSGSFGFEVDALPVGEHTIGYVLSADNADSVGGSVDVSVCAVPSLMSVWSYSRTSVTCYRDVKTAEGKPFVCHRKSSGSLYPDFRFTGEFDAVKASFEGSCARLMGSSPSMLSLSPVSYGEGSLVFEFTLGESVRKVSVPYFVYEEYTLKAAESHSASIILNNDISVGWTSVKESGVPSVQADVTWSLELGIRSSDGTHFRKSLGPYSDRNKTLGNGTEVLRSFKQEFKSFRSEYTRGHKLSDAEAVEGKMSFTVAFRSSWLVALGGGMVPSGISGFIEGEARTSTVNAVVGYFVENSGRFFQLKKS